MEERYLISMQKFMNSYYNFLEYKKDFQNIPDAKETYRQTLLSGYTKKFEILFDQAWKALSLFLVEYYGITSFVRGSPKDTLKKAYENGIIFDELWLNMLTDRNSWTHEYKEGDELEQYVVKIFEVYEPLYRSLCERFVEHRSQIKR